MNKSIINNIGLFIIVGILFIYYCNGQQQSIFNPSIANFQIEDNGLLFCKRNLNLTEIDYTSNIITNTLQCTSSSQSPSSSSNTESKNNAFNYLSFYTLGDVGAVGLVGIHVVNISSSSTTTTSNEDNNQLEEEEEEIAGILNFLQFNKFIIYQLQQQQDSSNTLLTPILNKNNILKTIYLNESIDSNYSFKIINNQQQLNQQLNRVLYITNTYTTEIGNVTIYSIVSEVHVKSNYSNNNLFYIIPSSIVNFISIDNFNIMDNHLQNSNLQFILDISYYGLSTTNITQLSQSTSTTTKNEENNNDGDDIPYKESENRNVITIQSLDNNLPNSFISFTKQVIVSNTGSSSTSSLPLQYNLFGISINGNNNNQSNNNEEENENENKDENILTFDDLPIPDDIDINLYKLYLFTSLNSLLTTTSGGGNSNNIFIGPIHLGIKEEVKSNCKCSIVNSGDGENRDNNNEQKNGDQQGSPQSSPQPSPQPTHSPIVSGGTRYPQESALQSPQPSPQTTTIKNDNVPTAISASAVISSPQPSPQVSPKQQGETSPQPTHSPITTGGTRYPQESALQSPSPQTTITKVDDNNVQPSPSPQSTTVNTDSPVTSAGNRYPQESALNSPSP